MTIDPAIEELPIARLEYRRARNPLSKQQHRSRRLAQGVGH